MPALSNNDTTIPLLSLSMPSAIWQGYKACCDVTTLITEGRLERTNRGIRLWIDAATTPRQRRARSDLIQLTRDFLGAGVPLEQARARLESRYREHLETPAARAALFLIRATGGTLVPMHEADELALPILQSLLGATTGSAAADGVVSGYAGVSGGSGVVPGLLREKAAIAAGGEFHA